MPESGVLVSIGVPFVGIVRDIKFFGIEDGDMMFYSFGGVCRYNSYYCLSSKVQIGKVDVTETTSNDSVV